MQISRSQAGRMFAQRTGLTVERAEQEIDNRSSRWTQFALENNIELMRDKDVLKSICARTAEDIDDALNKAWEQIKKVQGKIDDAIVDEDVRNMKELAGCVSQLQKSFLDLSEIKRQRDNDLHNVVSRDVVEAIISDCFPELKKALNDLFVNVKQTLKEEQRADFDNAFNRHLPNYSKHLTKTVEKLNKLFEK